MLFNLTFKIYHLTLNIGVWPSWLGHLNGVQGVGGSSPLIPTNH